MTDAAAAVDGEEDAPTAPPTDSGNVEEEEAAPSFLTVVTDKFFAFLLAPFVEIGMLARMLFEVIYWGFRPPYRARLMIQSMEFVGVGSIFIVSLTGLFLGAVLGLQLADGFRQFNAENQTGAVVGMAMTREIGPVFTALMVSSRAGSAITTELGSMRVSSQIDALTTMAVNPVQYLIVPRVFAGLIMVPLLTTLFVIIGMFGAYTVCVHLLGIDPGVFMDRFRWLVDWKDVLQGLIKAAVFGVTVTLVACRQGFHAKGGAAGVGAATNRSVVQNAIAILALDYLLTSIILGQV